MQIGEMEYIVKAKDSKIEIKSLLNDKIKIVLIIDIVLYFVLLLFVFEPGISIISTVQQLIFYTFIYMMFIIMYIVNFGWNFKIDNRKIYINILLKHYVINYSQLINITYQKEYRSKYMLIQYLENEQIKQIKLTSINKEYSKLKKINKLFITNKELQRGIKPEDEYFDIRDENLQNIIIKNKKMSLQDIVGLVFIVVFIFMLIINIIFFTLENIF